MVCALAFSVGVLGIAGQTPSAKTPSIPSNPVAGPVSYTHLHFSIGLNRTNSANIGAGVRYGHGSDWDSKLGITGAAGPMFPAINFSGGTAPVNLGDNVDGDTIDNGLRTADTVSWLKGKHDIKFGFDWRFQQFSPLNYQNTSGTWDFYNFQTAETIGDGTTGEPLASMLLGDLHDANVTAYTCLLYTSSLHAPPSTKRRN